MKDAGAVPACSTRFKLCVMNIVFGVIIAILVFVNAFLMAGVGYYAGYAKAEKELAPGNIEAILSFLSEYNGKKDPEEPATDPDPDNVESSPNC